MQTIRPNDFFPVLATDQLEECRDFYTTIFGFSVAFEEDWYVHLVTDAGIQLGFLQPGHPSQPKSMRGAFSGAGIVYSFEVEDVEWEFEKIEEAGVEVLLPVTVEEWGQKHFMIRDPAGMVIDIVESTEATGDSEDEEDEEDEEEEEEYEDEEE